MVFGSIGLAYFVYGKRQGAVVPRLSGMALFVFPCFISNSILLVLAGVILVGLPYFVGR